VRYEQAKMILDGSVMQAVERVEWHRSDKRLLAYNRHRGYHMLDSRDDVEMELNVTPITHEERHLLNAVLPQELTVTSKKDRWYITNSELGQRWAFYNTFPMHKRDGHWMPSTPVPAPRTNGVPKPIQRLAKKWATAYDVNLAARSPGMCGLCVITDGKLTARVLDNGTHERKHLLDHILSKTLPHEFMWGILHNTTLGHRMNDVLPFKAATYTAALHYAYMLLQPRPEPIIRLQELARAS